MDRERLSAKAATPLQVTLMGSVTTRPSRPGSLLPTRPYALAPHSDPTPRPPSERALGPTLWSSSTGQRSAAAGAFKPSERKISLNPTRKAVAGAR